MRRLLAVARAYSLGMLTYRTRTVVSLLSVLVAVIPVYFVAGALQPLAAQAIASESSEYFTYLIVGSVASFVIAEAVTSIPSLVNSYITSGTLEQMLTTPIRWPSLMAGLSTYGFGWVAMRALVLLVTAWIWATSTIAWFRIIEFCVHHGAAGSRVSRRRPDRRRTVCSSCARRCSFRRRVLTLSTLLGTVYFPVSVLPPAFAPLAQFVPMTPALRAARQVLLKRCVIDRVFSPSWCSSRDGLSPVYWLAVSVSTCRSSTRGAPEHSRSTDGACSHRSPHAAPWRCSRRPRACWWPRALPSSGVHLASQLPWSDVHWPTLVSLTSFERAESQIFRLLRAAPVGAVPEDVQRAVQGIYRVSVFRAAELAAAAGAAADALRAAGVDVLWLKGAALSMQSSDDFALRSMGDLDMLVDASQQPAARQALRDAGWTDGVARRDLRRPPPRRPDALARRASPGTPYRSVLTRASFRAGSRRRLARAQCADQLGSS